MKYTAKKMEFIVKAINCFIEAQDTTEADVRRSILTYLNIDPDFFSDEQLDTFEEKIQEAYHPYDNPSGTALTMNSALEINENPVIEQSNDLDINENE